MYTSEASYAIGSGEPSMLQAMFLQYSLGFCSELITLEQSRKLLNEAEGDAIIRSGPGGP